MPRNAGPTCRETVDRHRVNYARGRKGGRPRKLSSRDLKTVRTLVRSGEVPITTIAEQFGISRSTIYRNLGLAA
jgi:DNA invertase Pin-like site-specific DNA recombinase